MPQKHINSTSDTETWPASQPNGPPDPTPAPVIKLSDTFVAEVNAALEKGGSSALAGSEEELGRLSHRLEDAFNKLDHYDVAAWKAERAVIEANLHVLVNELEAINKNVGIGRTTGGGISIAGGALGLAGLIAAPFTAGSSLAFAGAGAGWGILGGLTAAGSTLTGTYISDNKCKKIDEDLAKHDDTTKEISALVNDVVQTLVEIAKVLDLCAIKLLLQQMETSFQALPMAERDAAILMTSLKLAKMAKSKLPPSLRGSADTDRMAMSYSNLAHSKAFGALFSRVASASAPAPGSSTPRFVSGTFYLGSMFNMGKAAGVGALILRGAASSAMGMASGIYDAVKGTQQLQNGSEVARDILQYEKNLAQQRINLDEALEAVGVVVPVPEIAVDHGDDGSVTVVTGPGNDKKSN